ncbi:MAG: rod shape-determining protein RodA [Gammaproteobacteria bacterium TMED92]|nr:MAG: rod shape-determining protein RodA [Gammaproteobacteria bacterium TMED92]
MSSDFQRQLPTGRNIQQDGWLYKVHLDPMLLTLVCLVLGFGLMVLYSAAGDQAGLFDAQVRRVLAAMAVLVIAAQLPPGVYLRWAPFVYVLGLLLLVLVLLVGIKVKGSQRWLEIPGLLRFQPSELMKIAVPMALAWYLQQRVLPPSPKHVFYSLVIIALPAVAIAAQPDLGTSILVAGAGLAVLLLAGLSWRYLVYASVMIAAAAPLLWQFALQGYQRQRIITLFDPDRDPLGAGWNIMQSTTAIGSGGVFGKGLLQGTQSHLDFLPEARTDFIIAVVGEELGLVGVIFLLLLYLCIIARGLVLAVSAQSTFARLFAGALTLTFFIYLFVNIAMVSGLLPVVGVPLPLVSYGGTSIITLMASFGIIMSMRTHKAW